MTPQHQQHGDDVTRPYAAPSSLSLRAELVTIAIITVIAAGLRLAFWNNVAIEHFDEGVYAANFYAGRLDDQFPDRHLYAPPLLPLLIEYSIVLGGGLHAALWVNLVTGVLLVPVLWWVGRSWFGPIAGLTAAALCAFSDVHLLYSRTALTDPLLTFFVALAAYAIWCAICQGGIIALVGSALLVAGAWWTKYNGWLPLAIATAGFVGWLIWGVHPQAFEDDQPASRSERRRTDLAGKRLTHAELLRVLGPRWLIVIVLSIAAWTPYVFMLQERGGYASVAANHAKYVGGLMNWVPAFWAQARNLMLLEGLATSLGFVCVAGLLVQFRGFPRTQREGLVMATYVLAVLAFTAWIGSSVILLGMGLWGTWQLFVARKTVKEVAVKAPDPIHSSESNLAGWMLSSWFVGLLLVTPMYQPYSRLTLPWLAASWLIVGMSASIVMGRHCGSSRTDQAADVAASPGFNTVCLWSVIAISSAVLLWQGPGIMARGVSGWSDRTGMQLIAPQLIDAAIEFDPTYAANDPDSVDAVFYVLAEPSLFVHLSALAIDSDLNYVAQPASSLAVTQLPEDPGFDVYLVVGPHMLADESQLAQIPSIVLVDTWDYAPSHLVWLDEFPGRSISELQEGDPRWQVRLYRVQ